MPPPDPSPSALPPVRAHPSAPRAGGFPAARVAAALGLAALGIAASAWIVSVPWRTPSRVAGGQAAGVNDEGRALPAGHPFLAAAAADAPVDGVAPLALRDGCTWGAPARMAYRGSIEQALATARLPRESVAQVAARVRAHRASDRVEIGRAGIRARRSGLYYGPRGFALAFGDTLCLNTRVNFAAGEATGGDLYQVMSGDGREVAVVVADANGAVAVMGGIGERRGVGDLLWLAAGDALVAALGGEVAWLWADDPAERGASARPGPFGQAVLALAEAWERHRQR